MFWNDKRSVLRGNSGKLYRYGDSIPMTEVSDKRKKTLMKSDHITESKAAPEPKKPEKKKAKKAKE